MATSSTPALTRRNFIMTAAMASAVAATANVAIAEGIDADAVMNEVATRAGDDWASKVTEELSCDVLIVGAGFSGTCAAVQAAQNGDSVIVCEGQSFMGGNGLGVECTNAYGLHPNSEGVSLGEMVAAEAREQAYTTNQMYTRDMIMHAADNVQWLIDNGVQYQPVDQLDEAYLEMYSKRHI